MGQAGRPKTITGFQVNKIFIFTLTLTLIPPLIIFVFTGRFDFSHDMDFDYESDFVHSSSCIRLPLFLFSKLNVCNPHLPLLLASFFSINSNLPPYPLRFLPPFLISFLSFCALSVSQTHTTPVLLGHRDRAELAGQEYSTLVSVMEGVVIVDKIPETPTQT